MNMKYFHIPVNMGTHQEEIDRSLFLSQTTLEKRTTVSNYKKNQHLWKFFYNVLFYLWNVSVSGHVARAQGNSIIKVSGAWNIGQIQNGQLYSWLSLSRLRLSRITAYLEETILSLF